MGLLSKYLDIMKCNQDILSDIANDANLEGSTIDNSIMLPQFEGVVNPSGPVGITPFADEEDDWLK